MFEAWSYQSIASTSRIIGMSFNLLVLLSKEAGLNRARILTVSMLHRAWIQLRQCQILIDVNLHSHFRWWMLTEKNLILFSVLLTFFIKHMGRQKWKIRHASEQHLTACPENCVCLQRTLFIFTFRFFWSRKMPFTWEMQRDCVTPTPWLFRAVNACYIPLEKNTS